MGFFSSGMIFPRMRRTIRTGARVTERKAAKNMAKVLVKARGLKSLPSWASRVKMGRKETVMINREKKRGRPTSLAAWITSSIRGMGLPSFSHSSNRVWAFSTMMMAASTMAPMAMAIPPEGHDVRPQVDVMHGGEGQENGKGQSEDRH